MMRQWASIGVRNVERAGFTERHTLVESFDYIALPKLLQEGARFDFAFIDGMHLFDYTLLDFFFVDVMLDVGGWVIVRCRLDCSSSLSLSLSLSPSSSPFPPPTSAHRRVVLDDCAMPAIDDLVSYIRANCPHYEFEGYTGQQTSRKMKQATFIKRANDERAASRIASGKNHSSFF